LFRCKMFPKFYVGTGYARGATVMAPVHSLVVSG
jgi:hypothetical protein